MAARNRAMASVLNGLILTPYEGAAVSRNTAAGNMITRKIMNVMRNQKGNA